MALFQLVTSSEYLMHDATALSNSVTLHHICGKHTGVTLCVSVCILKSETGPRPEVHEKIRVTFSFKMLKKKKKRKRKVHYSSAVPKYSLVVFNLGYLASSVLCYCMKI